MSQVWSLFLIIQMILNVNQAHAVSFVLAGAKAGWRSLWYSPPAPRELFSPSKKQYTIRSGWLDSYSLAYTWTRFLGTNKFASFYPIDTII